MAYREIDMKTIQKKCIGFLVEHTELSRWIPDKWYLKQVYKGYMDKNLNLVNPKTFNEKIQWLKLYNRRKEFTGMVDKYEAKQFIGELIGWQYVIPTIGIYNDFSEIDISTLPEQFVIKCTHDSGGLYICRNLKNFDADKARYLIEKSQKNRFYYKFREWAYKRVQPRIIVEQYMEDKSTESLVDYKFFCFNGEPKFLYVSEGLENHETAKISFFDLKGQKLPFYRKDYKPFEEDMVLPLCMDEMTNLAKQIASNIDTPFVRIDLYEINEKVYFSEITFYPNGGLIPFEPAEWDETLGDLIILDKYMKRG